MSQAKSNASPIGVQKYLKGIDYPARKEDLISTAQKNKATREVMDELKRLPDGPFNSPADVMSAYGQKQGSAKK